MFSAREHDASRMTALLRGLDLLVTSRFHAAVLSLAAGVPQVAVGHDTRLDTLYRDLGLREEWFLDLRERRDPAALFAGLGARVERLLARPRAAARGAAQGATPSTWPAPGRTAGCWPAFAAEQPARRAAGARRPARERRRGMGGLILLTGATGFLGAQVARLLLRDTDHRLAVLVRGRDEAEARRRLERAWSDWPETGGRRRGRPGAGAAGRPRAARPRPGPARPGGPGPHA